MNPTDGLVKDPKIVKASPIFSMSIANKTQKRSNMIVTKIFIIFDISFLNKRHSRESLAGSIQRGVAKTTVKRTQQIPIVNPTFAS